MSLTGSGSAASFLVPYGHESSEESDQEGGFQENGLVNGKENGGGGGVVYGPQPTPPPNTNSQAGAYHNGHGIDHNGHGSVGSAGPVNHNGHGSIGSTAPVNGVTRQNGHLNGHQAPEKVNVWTELFYTFRSSFSGFIPGHMMS